MQEQEVLADVGPLPACQAGPLLSLRAALAARDEPGRVLERCNLRRGDGRTGRRGPPRAGVPGHRVRADAALHAPGRRRPWLEHLRARGLAAPGGEPHRRRMARRHPVAVPVPHHPRAMKRGSRRSGIGLAALGSAEARCPVQSLLIRGRERASSRLERGGERGGRHGRLNRAVGSRQAGAGSPSEAARRGRGLRAARRLREAADQPRGAGGTSSSPVVRMWMVLVVTL